MQTKYAKASRMNYLHDCSYGSPYLLSFRESQKLFSNNLPHTAFGQTFNQPSHAKRELSSPRLQLIHERHHIQRIRRLHSALPNPQSAIRNPQFLGGA